MFNRLNVLILGASGIGKFHVREFHLAGCNISISGINQKNIEKNKIEYESCFGIDSIKIYKDYDEALKNKFDIISIATPKEFHFSQIKKALENGAYVFCEKPVFWDSSLSEVEFLNKLNWLRKNAEGKLCINTNNSFFMSWYISKFTTKEVKYFEFGFNSHGGFNYDDIGIDLLPHAISLLLKLEKKFEITNLKKEVNIKNYKCEFFWGKIKCCFNLSQDSLKEKSFYFIVNDQKLNRVQKMINGKYKLFVETDNLLYEIEDTFKSSIKSFVNYVFKKDLIHTSLEESLKNIELMHKIVKD